MSDFTLTHGAPSAPRLALHGFWNSLRARLGDLSLGQAPAAGPLGQAATELYTRGMLGWRG